MKRLALFATVTSLAALACAAPASAVPVFNLDVRHNATNFAPGGIGEYWFDVENVGDTASVGPLTLTFELPPGLTRSAVWGNQKISLEPNWSCPGLAGDTTITCTTSESIPRYSSSYSLVIDANVAASLRSGLTRTAIATLRGGGGAEAPAAAGCAPGLDACATEKVRIDATPAPFGIPAESFSSKFTDADGITPVLQSGAHPDLFTTAFDFNSVDAPDPTNPVQKHEAENVRDLTVDLPPGFIGNPSAVGECSPADFTVLACPYSSQVGMIGLHIAPIASPGPNHGYNAGASGVYNLSHPRGVITDIAISVNGNPVHIKASLDPARNYAIRTTVSDINETFPPFGQRLVLWGVPGDHSHDAQRCGPLATISHGTELECSTNQTARPFITAPFQCEVEHVATIHHYDSWQRTGAFGPPIDYAMPGPSTGCDRPRFEPQVSVHPTGQQASTPTGLDVHIEVPQNENPNSLSTPPIRDTVVTLPVGMSLSPSFADGLTSCSLAQIGLGTNEPVTCPDSSRVGEVELKTPLLHEPLEGSMYLAAQGENPFGSLFALYLVLHDTEERGISLKLPGRIDLDQATGQITTSFDETPQFPFEDLTLKFRSGPRAPLINPPSCGTQVIGVKVSSWAQPADPVDLSNSYEINEGPNGTPCPGSTAVPSFSPRLTAGTLNPLADSYSPFVFRLGREDAEQELSRLTAVLPEGLLAKIAGLTPCPDVALASISDAEGTAAAQLAVPACPAASQIGTVSAGLGAGPSPSYFPGTVYLAGPYKGAPLSLAVVVPGLAGPFDLGTTVVRAAIEVDHETAQVTAVSNPFPTILHGVLLRVRDVRLRVDRPETTLNPTNCEPMAVAGLVVGTAGAQFSTADRFQVGDCAALAFKPKLALRLFGGNRRAAHPKLRATLTYPKGVASANIARASVALPHSEFLEQAHIRTICTRVQFAHNACPPGSAYGFARALTPLFDTPLEGPVYLRSSSHPLPDMVAMLKGPASLPVEVDLVGRIDSVRGGIRNTFEVVPDAPVSSFTLELAGGKKGLLVNSTNLCRKVNRATAKFSGQNGALSISHPPLQSSCKKARKARHGRAGRRR